MYLAKKRCKFAGRTFNMEEAIPEGYVHHTAAPRLISMGVIAEASGGLLLPPEPSIEEPQQEIKEETPAPEPESAESEPVQDANETEGQEMEELMKHKRDELVQMAEQYGIEDMEGHTKKELSEAILKAKNAALEA